MIHQVLPLVSVTKPKSGYWLDMDNRDTEVLVVGTIVLVVGVKVVDDEPALQVLTHRGIRWISAMWL